MGWTGLASTTDSDATSIAWAIHQSRKRAISFVMTERGGNLLDFEVRPDGSILAEPDQRRMHVAFAHPCTTDTAFSPAGASTWRFIFPIEKAAWRHIG